MTDPARLAEHLGRPDQHLDPAVAAVYDEGHRDRFDDGVVAATVDVLAELAGAGPVVEFAVGTGRIALPLAARGVEVLGIDFSQPMLAALSAKPGAESIVVTRGDMTATQVCDDASLVYLVFNTIGNLRTQHAQVRCFLNAAAHLAPGGRFVIEVGVPQLHLLPAGQTVRPFDVSDRHLGFDEYIDPVNQLLVSHHFYFDADGDRCRRLSGAFRYVWPSELDLMAELAGLEFESRWADWDRTPFTADSPAHVSVWRKPEAVSR